MTRFQFIFMSLLFLASSSSAGIIKIEYTAHISSITGDGLGYQDGDLIAGSFVIDTSKAEGNNYDNPTFAWYYGSLGSGLLQSSFGAPAIDGYVDFVRVINDPSQNDALLLNKVLSVSGSTSESLSTRIEFNEIDWISDLTLNNINFVSKNEDGLSFGEFARLDSRGWILTDRANFMFDSISISSILTSVPEPAPLVLLLIAAAGLIIRRRLI
jgi:hypothetical protein